jgi:hypothetical protein
MIDRRNKQGDGMIGKMRMRREQEIEEIDELKIKAICIIIAIYYILNINKLIY